MLIGSAIRAAVVGVFSMPAFLDLLGVTLFPPTNATADVVFWLSAPREDSVTVPARTEVGTPRTELSEPIVFSTVEQLEIPPRTLHRLGSTRHDDELARLQVGPYYTNTRDGLILAQRILAQRHRRHATHPRPLSAAPRRQDRSSSRFRRYDVTKTRDLP